MNESRGTYLFSFILLICSVTCFKNISEITIKQGKLKGAVNERENCIQFFGIPYASVQERFQEPGDPPSWNGTLIAIQEQPQCIQYSKLKQKAVGQEDCLFLNVYRPLTELKEPAAVIVFLPGGAYTQGSNTNRLYNPKYLIRKNVIVVTVNSRLGAFGLLCLNIKGATGNMALKDQKAALKWVRDNIFEFGGNPNCVTLIGSSSGACTITYFLFSNSANGLFHRAMIHSGTMISPRKYDETPIETASAVALHMGYNTSNPHELLEIFTNANDIIRASHEVLLNGTTGRFKPCLENSSISENPVITEPVIDLLKSSKPDPNIDIILGYTNKEGLSWLAAYNSTGRQNIEQNLVEFIPHNFQFRNDTEKLCFIEDIRNFYFQNSSIDDGLTDFFSDCFVMYPSVEITEALLFNGNTVYNYYFEYDSRRNFNKFVLPKDLSKIPGAAHGDELCYIFDQVVFKKPPIPQDVRMINTLTTLWTNFAKTGIPSSSCMKFPWYRSEKEIIFLDINKKFEMISLPNEERIKFWKSAHEKYSMK